jgi:hypothetical protein
MPWDEKTEREYERQKRMKVGEKLPCGCEVVRPAWTREETRNAVYEALSETLADGTDAGEIIFSLVDSGEDTPLRSLGLDTKSLRKFWGKFFVATDVPMTKQEDGSNKYMVGDDHLPKIPETIGDMIEEVFSLHQNPTFKACWPHAF